MGLDSDIHEMPRISRTGSLLQEGHVVTVEPGLYYPGLERRAHYEEHGVRHERRVPQSDEFSQDV